MAKIHFSIDYRPQIESGKYKVITRNERQVRIICWDKKTGGRDSIVALVTGEGGENEKTIHYDCNGRCIASGICECNKDLFIITPEPELTEWQTFISGCLQKYGLLDCGAADRIAKECSAELLDLAKTELTCRGNIVLSIEEFEKCFIGAQEKGRREALEDLPRWRKEQGEMEFAAYGIIGGGVASQENPRVYLNGYSIDLYSLKKLPKEDEK